MKIRKIEFVGSVGPEGNEHPGGYPEIAFSGRSNVGKSSLINTLVRRTRKKIARVSQTPGKTQTINFYRVNDAFHLVDLPGFGYAKVPDEVRTKWGPLVEDYLLSSPELRGVVHLVDARHRPTHDDRQMLEFLAREGLPTLVVMTKVDKLSWSERGDQENVIRNDLEIDDEQLLPFSAKTGEGRDELLTAVEHLLEGA